MEVLGVHAGRSSRLEDVHKTARAQVAPPNEPSPVDGASGAEARQIRFPDSTLFAPKSRRKNVVSRAGRKNPDGRRPQPGGDVYGLRPCLLYTSPSPRDGLLSRMPSSA